MNNNSMCIFYATKRNIFFLIKLYTNIKISPFTTNNVVSSTTLIGKNKAKDKKSVN